MENNQNNFFNTTEASINPQALQANFWDTELPPVPELPESIGQPDSTLMPSTSYNSPPRQELNFESLTTLTPPLPTPSIPVEDSLDNAISTIVKDFLNNGGSPTAFENLATQNDIPRRNETEMSWEYDNFRPEQPQLPQYQGMAAPSLYQPPQNVQWQQPQAIAPPQQLMSFDMPAPSPMAQPVQIMQWRQPQTIVPQQMLLSHTPTAPQMHQQVPNVPQAITPQQPTYFNAPASPSFNAVAVAPALLERQLADIAQTPAPGSGNQQRQLGAGRPSCNNQDQQPRRKRATAMKNKPILQCEKCSYKTANKEEMRRHSDSVHNGIRRHRCDVCNISVNDPSGLSKHKKGKKHKQNVREQEREKGIVSHRKEFEYQCPECKKNGRLWRHPRSDHLKRHFLGNCPYTNGALPDGFIDGAGGMDKGKVEVVGDVEEKKAEEAKQAEVKHAEEAVYGDTDMIF
jgi:Zinc-finger of C2H2 type